MPFDDRNLLTVSALVLSCALAAPAAAQVAGPPADAPETPPAIHADEAQAPARLEAMSAGGRGIIRPLSGPIGLNSGRTTTFAGDVVGTASRIRAMEDKVGASASRIRAMAGELSGFASRIRAMSTDPVIGAYTYNLTGNTFWGSQYGSQGALMASASRIRAMDGTVESFASRIRAMASRIRAMDGTLLSFDSAPSDYQGIHREITGLVATTKGVWGSAVQTQTGKSFEDGFSNRMLGKWGVNLGDARSIAGMNEVDMELFLLDWRDNVLLFSGVDSVDHWMKAVNWTPAMSQQLGSGLNGDKNQLKVRVGLLDFAVTADPKANVAGAGGVSQVAGAHGNAVASLIVGAHDGRGVMGLAPKADLYSYVPFDRTQTASWEDITKGLHWLGDELEKDVHVINLSLGVPGYTFHHNWRNVLGDSDVKSDIQDAVFVIAAGNDGITQTEHVNMAGALDSTFLVVGSVNPDNAISGFSNRPGVVCLTDNGVCKNTLRWSATEQRFDGKSDYLKESGLLMNRFLVAPGEFMLVDDGTGDFSAGVKSGVTRMSGTSFAAPLVSGTVALIAERWPWLTEKPIDVAHIILSSATDLGERGTDPIYGRGMLNVEAAMAPLDWNKVEFKQSTNGGGLVSTSFATLRATSAYTRSTWEANRAYFYVFEKTTSSHRDFYIPMSSKLVGQTVGSNRDQMNAYLQSRFQTALGTPTRFAGDTGPSFGPARLTAPTAGFGEISATVTMSPRAWRPGLRQGTTPFDTGMAFSSPDGRIAMRFGSGSGGADIDGRAGFGFQSDYDLQTGGANPFLGLASGSGYVATDVALTDRLTVSAGASTQTARRDLDQLSQADRMALGRLEPYRANASLLSVRYRAAGWLNATASYTMLGEDTGLLGVQSLDRFDLRQGTTTDAATFGTDVTPGHGLAVSMSGTVGRTRATDLSRQNMGVAAGGLVSSAFQVAVAKVGLFDERDRARITLAQPLHVESGSIAVNQFKVINRRTGALGTEIETFALQSGERRFVAEAMYGRSVLGGQADLSLFGRANLRGDAADQSAVTLGGSFRLGF
ncbi:S8 family peptidase [uncultured Sphingomonas sp.]|uniref:S8 family peptidase n=1 Tax=uncultured Sphingomonas sp. TaxID=158754 RepID=UPI0035CBC41F